MNTGFDVKNLCSRKLWEMISTEDALLAPPQLSEVEAELRERRHYLPELQARRQLDQEQLWRDH